MSRAGGSSSGAVAGTASGAPIRVVLADDHAVVRGGLRALLEEQPGVVVVGEAADGEEAHQQACALAPDVLVLDLSMPRVGGVEAAERIARDCPRVRVLALTMHEERGYVARLLRAGAAGYVLKRTAAEELVRAVRAVAAGGTYVDPSLAGALLTAQVPSRGLPPRAQLNADGLPHAGPDAVAEHVGATDGLTPREAEVLQMVARGHSGKEVAAALAISVKTVETHKANAMAKLGLGGRAALVRFAVDQGWLTNR